MPLHLGRLMLLAAALMSLGARATEPAPAAGAADAAITITHVERKTPGFAYPLTKRDDLVEDHFGIKVADPYRWLENNARTDRDVRDWVARENRATAAYLGTLPGRDILHRRMERLYDYGRYSTPRKAGGRYFYTYNSGLQNQSPLFVREGLAGTQRLLIDPNRITGDHATALAQWVPSPDGRTLLYALQEHGSDWRTLKLIDVDSGRPLDDIVRWVRFSELGWDAEGKGFFYSRFPEPEDGRAAQSAIRDQQVWYHRLGTDQSADLRIYATPDRPEMGHSAEVTDDGQWLLISSSVGTAAERELTLVSLKPGWQERRIAPRRLVRGLDHQWIFVGGRGDTLWFITDWRAPHQRLVTLDAAHPGRRPLQILGERPDTLVAGNLVGSRIILAYLTQGRTIAEMVEMDGRRVGDVPLPSMGTAAGFGGKGGDPETFFSFSGYTTPSTVYRYDTDSNRTELFAQPALAFRPDDFTVDLITYPSKDGTMVPMYIIRRKDLAEKHLAAPTLLYGYGGFNIALTPGFSPTRLAWLEQGGVVAIANVRGGGEYGRAWHDAGRRENKQNVFDDFIAAAEYLKSAGYTGEDQLAIEGRSNGGLLVGAVVNQRPDLFAAALPAVGVMDMLRFDRFTAGRYWVDDYGSPENEQDFRTLYSYSPYHNIAAGRDYPAIMVTTADSDDRVVPAHSFKYAAALQASMIGDKPHLIRVDANSGHGSGKPTDKIIDEYADIYAFAAYWTGLRIAEPGRSAR
jgi:prolyl oligopeptidase